MDVKYKKINYENKKITLSIWDTSGQEKFRSMASNLYRNCNAIIFLFDISNKDSFDKLKYWIENIKQYLDDSIELVLVENKIDLEGKREVSKGYVKGFTEKKKIDFLSASAKTGEGVEEIFRHLISKLILKKGNGKNEDDEDNIGEKSFHLSIKKNEENKENKVNKCKCK